MDIEKLIEQLNGYFEGKDLKRGVALDAATALSALQAENEKLRAELEQMAACVYYKQGGLCRYGEEDPANVCVFGPCPHQRSAQEVLAELGQVKHQRDSYRLYHDDLASKPNCNTCADKDCKYRPIPGDTVRANCPLWRGSEEGEQNV